MPKVMLADVVKAADAKYGPFVLGLGDDSEVTLLNGARIEKEKRKRLIALQKEQKALQDAGDVNPDQEESFLYELVRLIAASDDDAQRLLNATAHDFALLAEVIDQYSEATQVGEALPSQS